MPAPVTTEHTWPINTGVTLSFAGGDGWLMADGTPVTTGSLVLTIRDAAGTLIDTFNGAHVGSPDGTWKLDVDAFPLAERSMYEFELIGTPSGGQPVTQHWWALGAYLAPRFRISV